MEADESEAIPGSKYLHREEWMLMFMAGVPVEKIARVCSVPRRTVYRHIWRRVKAEPWRRGRRLVIHDQPALPIRPIIEKRPTWDERCSALKEFQQVRNRMPSPNSKDPIEQSLISWVYGQRRKSRRGELSDEQLSRLDDIPGWWRPPKADVEEDRWQLRLQETTAFRQQSGRWPRYANGQSDTERVLAAWLANQREQLNRDALLQHRKDQIDQVLSAWDPARGW